MANPFVARFCQEYAAVPWLIDFSLTSLNLFSVAYLDIDTFFSYDEEGGIKYVGMPREDYFVDRMRAAFSTRHRLSADE